MTSGRQKHARVRGGRATALLASLALLWSLLLVPSATAGSSDGTYTNPVAGEAVTVFPDPVTIRAKDGYWYAYGTTNPTLQDRGDDSLHYIPILRSDDMVDWEYVGDLFTKKTLPDWIPDEASLWAPDIRYVDGTYYLYYSVAHVPPGEAFGSPEATFTMGVATAPTPTGPWTDSGGPVIPENDDCPAFTDIDPALYTDVDGTTYFYWGSFRAMCVAEMNEDATRIVGEVTRIANIPGEGPFVVRHGGYYYVFFSESACCSGAFSGYHLKVARSKSPRGPFVDRQGVPINAARGGGTFVVAAGGNRWVGPGHNSVQTDLAGQDWLVYHAVPRGDPYLAPADRFGQPYRYTTRNFMIDRLDWVDGWPVVRGGRGASEDAQPAPVTSWNVGSEFNDQQRIGQEWRREGAAQDGWALAQERDAGAYVEQRAPSARPAYLASSGDAPARVRVEGDLRLNPEFPAGRAGAVGLVAAYQDPGDHIVAWLDAAKHALVTDVRVDGASAGRKVTPLPAGFDLGEWHNVAVEIRGTRLRVEVSHARLGDPLALQERTVPGEAARAGSVGVASRGARSHADNLGGTRLSTPTTDTADPPPVGETAFHDGFDDGVPPGRTPDSPWEWVRGPEGHESAGSFQWPTDGDEIFRNFQDNASLLLLKDVPTGDYTVETKVSIAPQRGNQEAGLLLYVGDDQYLTLTHELFRNRWNLTKFLEEGTSEVTGVTPGRTFVGPTARTLWLRLSHRVDPQTGEHEIRAATSRDGAHWVWGGVWTLPPDAQPRVGMASLGRPGVVAEFDYFRLHRP